MPVLKIKRPKLMAVLNITPDSFSDAGKYNDSEAAVRRALELVAQGADVLDIGAESTRPGSTGVSPDEQLRRLLPVLHSFRKQAYTPVSIDTQSASVATACLDAGANIINDISALRHDSAMARALRPYDCPIILMHMQGTPLNMQDKPVYENIVDEINQFFQERLRFCQESGIAAERLLLDPGIGFGKTLEHNLEILRRLEEFRVLKRPLVIGVSRKGFIGKLTDEPVPERRVAGSVAAGLLAALHGAAILRVHDVAEHRAALNVLDAICNPKN